MLHCDWSTTSRNLALDGGGRPTFDGEGRGHLPWMGEGYLPWMGREGVAPTLDGGEGTYLGWGRGYLPWTRGTLPPPTSPVRTGRQNSISSTYHAADGIPLCVYAGGLSCQTWQ